MNRHLAIKLEQFRQARRVHGSLLKFGVALLGVKLARLPIPRRLRLPLYRSVYSRKYPPGLDETEADRPLTAYRSLNALFTRGIKPECRPIPADACQFLSPCDGTVQEIGRVNAGKLVTLKGIEYRLASLLPNRDTAAFEGGHFVVIFLSPIHCHRVFSPQDGSLEEASHVPGYRLLVHPPYQRVEYPVYALNERMILRLSTALGPCLLIMVAGWGVGNITLPLAPEYRPRSRQAAIRRWLPPARLRRGDWIATFELGSTVVLLAPPGASAMPLVTPLQEVKYGQPVLSYAEDEG
jgi:phosphatidylserine decarboxylase